VLLHGGRTTDAKRMWCRCRRAAPSAAPASTTAPRAARGVLGLGAQQRELIGAETQLARAIVVDDRHPALGDRPEARPEPAELADGDDVQRRAQRRRDLRGDGHAACWSARTTGASRRSGASWAASRRPASVRSRKTAGAVVRTARPYGAQGVRPSAQDRGRRPGIPVAIRPRTADAQAARRREDRPTMTALDERSAG
jgi:hypothetical protein